MSIRPSSPHQSPHLPVDITKFKFLINDNADKDSDDSFGGERLEVVQKFREQHFLTDLLHRSQHFEAVPHNTRLLDDEQLLFFKQKELRNETSAALYRIAKKDPNGNFCIAVPLTHSTNFEMRHLSVVGVISKSHDRRSSTEGKHCHTLSLLFEGDVIVVNKLMLLHGPPEDHGTKIFVEAYEVLERASTLYRRLAICIPRNVSKNCGIEMVLSSKHPIDAKPVEVRIFSPGAARSKEDLPRKFRKWVKSLTKLDTFFNGQGQDPFRIGFVSVDIVLPLSGFQRYPAGLSNDPYHPYYPELAQEFLELVTEYKQTLVPTCQFPPFLLNVRDDICTFDEIVKSEDQVLLTHACRLVNQAIDVVATTQNPHDYHVYPSKVLELNSFPSNSSIRLKLAVHHTLHGEQWNRESRVLIRRRSPLPSVYGRVVNVFELTGSSDRMAIGLAVDIFVREHQDEADMLGTEEDCMRLYDAIRREFAEEQLLYIKQEKPVTYYGTSLSKRRPELLKHLFPLSVNDKEKHLFGPRPCLSAPLSPSKQAEWEDLMRKAGLWTALSEEQLNTVRTIMYGTEPLCVIDCPAGGGKTTTTVASTLSYAYSSLSGGAEHQYATILTDSNGTVVAIAEKVEQLFELCPTWKEALRVVRITSEDAMNRKDGMTTKYDSTKIFRKAVFDVVDDVLNGRRQSVNDRRHQWMVVTAFSVRNTIVGGKPISVPENFSLSALGDKEKSARGRKPLEGLKVKAALIMVGFFFYQPHLVIGTSAMISGFRRMEVTLSKFPALLIFDEASTESVFSIWKAVQNHPVSPDCRLFLVGDSYQPKPHSPSPALGILLRNAIEVLKPSSASIEQRTVYRCQPGIVRLLEEVFYRRGVVHHNEERPLIYTKPNLNPAPLGTCFSSREHYFEHKFHENETFRPTFFLNKD